LLANNVERDVVEKVVDEFNDDDEVDDDDDENRAGNDGAETDQEVNR
jgi:hypothetical protein